MTSRSNLSKKLLTNVKDPRVLQLLETYRKIDDELERIDAVVQKALARREFLAASIIRASGGKVLAIGDDRYVPTLTEGKKPVLRRMRVHVGAKK